MVMSWGNGSYSCDECGNDVDQSGDLASVWGGTEVGFIETLSGQYERVEVAYSMNVCPDCYKRRVDEIAARLLCW